MINQEVTFMKRILSLLLAVVLILSVAVLPALAAQDAEQSSFICPACGGTCYEDMDLEPLEVVVTTTCVSSSVSHRHRNVYLAQFATCDTCGYQLLVYRGELYYSECLL